MVSVTYKQDELNGEVHGKGLEEVDGTDGSTQEGSETGTVKRGNKYSADSGVRGRDVRLYELVRNLHQDLNEANDIIEQMHGQVEVYDAIGHDLDHLLEIEELGTERYAVLQKYRKESRLDRRVAKNVNSVEGILGGREKEWLNYLTGKLAIIEAISTVGNKHYGLRSEFVLEIFEELTGKTVESTEGRYRDVTDTKKEEKIDELIEQKGLQGKKFNKELRKVLGKGAGARRRKGKR